MLAKVEATDIPPRGGPSTVFLDGIRGLAALEVLAGHACVVLYANYRYGYLRHPSLYSPAEKMILFASYIFQFGKVAVAIFFVLSGFVIHLRYARKLQSGLDIPTFSWASFIFRRARRIYPPLIFAIATTFVFDKLGIARGFSIYKQATGDPLLTAIVPPLSHNLKTLLGNLAFLNNAYVAVWGSDNPLWSLMYEWWFYMLYPVYWLLLRRSLFAATTVVAVLYGLSFFPPAWTIVPGGILFRGVFALMPIWWLGVLLAEMHSGRIRRRFGWIALLTCLIPVLAYLQIAHKPIPEILWGAGCAGLISLGFWWQETGGTVRPLERLRWLGDMSYTLYVVHFPILVFAGGWLISRSPNGELPRHIGWALVGIACVLPPCFLAHYLVERPFVRPHRPDQVPTLPNAVTTDGRI